MFYACGSTCARDNMKGPPFCRGPDFWGNYMGGSFSVPTPLGVVPKGRTKTEKVRNVGRNQFAEIQINGVVGPFSGGNANFAK